jgi:hypothetical protein
MLELDLQILEECRAVIAGTYRPDPMTSPAIAQDEPREVRFAREILRLQQSVAENAGPAKEAKANVLKDDPEWDGTDGAHPAWWRGHDHAVAVICQNLCQILDGAPFAGVCNEPWESVRKRLAELVRVILNFNAVARVFVGNQVA